MVKRNKIHGALISLACTVFLLSPQAFAQDNLYDLPLEDLLQIIVIASKKEEQVFDSPMAATVITRREILNSGATNIPEALRLAPGLIVREQSSGNYDVHIRGLDNVPPRSTIRTASNSLTLVMIDNRPIYNHFTGGTFWETLPISIVDVERIEIIRGAATALYGPNAVTGVINIVTLDQTKTKHATQVHVQQGSFSSTIAELTTSKHFSEVLDARLSLNLEQRERQDTRYYAWATADYVDGPDDIIAVFPSGPLTNPDLKYPDPKNAVDKFGANVFVNASTNNLGQISLDLGAQRSEAQKIYDDVAATPFSTVKSDSWYLDLQSEKNDVKTKLSYQAGSTDTLDFGFGFDYSNFDLLLETKKKIGSVELQPLLEYRKDSYSGEAFSEEDSIATTSAGFRSEYHEDKLRLIGTMRFDHYDFSDNIENSHMLGASYKFNDSFLVYSVHSNAHQDPFMYNTFSEIFFPLSENFGFLALGNENLKLVSTTNMELGLRWESSHRTKVEIEFFQHEIENYQIIFKNGETGFVGSTPVEILQYQNVPTHATQNGVTFNLSYLNTNWSAAFNCTHQKTEIKNWVEFLQFEAVGTGSSKNLNTPDYFGGFNFNYHGWEKVMLDINGYFIGDYELITTYSPPEAGKVDSNFILNSKLSYQLQPSVKTFLNIRNGFDRGKTEFAFADQVGASYFIGLEIRL